VIPSDLELAMFAIDASQEVKRTSDLFLLALDICSLGSLVFANVLTIMTDLETVQLLSHKLVIDDQTHAYPQACQLEVEHAGSCPTSRMTRREAVGVDAVVRR
jgi:hypothetical protein